MVRIRSLVTLTVLCAAALAVAACAGDPDEGKAPFTPDAGVAREIFTNQSVDTSIKVPAMNINGTLSDASEVIYLATPGEPGADGVVPVEVLFDNVTGSMSGELIPGMDMSFMNDIDKAVGEGLTGKSFTVNIGRDGRVASAAGGSGIIDGVVTKVNDVSLPAEMADSLTGIISEIANARFGDDALRSDAEHFSVPRSLEKLEPEMTWTNDRPTYFGNIAVDASYTYTVASVDEFTATIQEAATYTLDKSKPGLISMLTSSPVIKAMGEPTFDLSGTGTGTYTVDLASGWATAYDGTATMTGKFAAGPVNADVEVAATRDFVSAAKP
jgi:hypothetical protein